MHNMRLVSGSAWIVAEIDPAKTQTAPRCSDNAGARASAWFGASKKSIIIDASGAAPRPRPAQKRSRPSSIWRLGICPIGGHQCYDTQSCREDARSRKHRILQPVLWIWLVAHVFHKIVAHAARHRCFHRVPGLGTLNMGRKIGASPACVISTRWTSNTILSAGEPAERYRTEIRG